MFRNMLISAVLLAVFATVGTGVVAFTEQATKQRRIDNEKAAVLRNLHALVSPDEHDNDLYTDVTYVSHAELLGTNNPVAVYRARRGDLDVAAILSPVAPDGYSGKIKLLVAIRYNGELAGVRVLEHRETPGLGDAIEVERSDWIRGFNTKSLADPLPTQWAVKRDGGTFDQFTGATITPRAVVKAVKLSLQYYAKHRDGLFAAPKIDIEEQYTDEEEKV